jgi:hypothetical protein
MEILPWMLQSTVEDDEGWRFVERAGDWIGLVEQGKVGSLGAGRSTFDENKRQTPHKDCSHHSHMQKLLMDNPNHCCMHSRGR